MKRLHCHRTEAGEDAEKPAELDPKLAREAAKLAVCCAVCEEPAKLSWLECPSCTARAHLTCLASHFIQVRPPLLCRGTHTTKPLKACPLHSRPSASSLWQQRDSGRTRMATRCGVGLSGQLSAATAGVCEVQQRPVHLLHRVAYCTPLCQLSHVSCSRRCVTALQSDPLQPSVPARGPCPMCGDERTWAEALLSEKHVGWAGRRSGRVRPNLKADPKLK